MTFDFIIADDIIITVIVIFIIRTGCVGEKKDFFHVVMFTSFL